MKERGMIFAQHTIPKLLDGSKTQTRRPVKGLPDDVLEVFYWAPDGGKKLEGWADPGCYYRTPKGLRFLKSSYGQVGDRIWVRETWADQGDGNVAYKADQKVKCEGRFIGLKHEPKWKPSIHMPRWASRITLEITDVRVERIQDISGEDVLKEGLDINPCVCPVDHAILHFGDTWNSIYPGSWKRNEYVWVYQFKRIEQ